MCIVALSLAIAVVATIGLTHEIILTMIDNSDGGTLMLFLGIAILAAILFAKALDNREEDE
jgi:hypothetical protein